MIYSKNCSRKDKLIKHIVNSHKSFCDSIFNLTLKDIESGELFAYSTDTIYKDYCSNTVFTRIANHMKNKNEYDSYFLFKICIIFAGSNLSENQITKKFNSFQNLFFDSYHFNNPSITTLSRSIYSFSNAITNTVRNYNFNSYSRYIDLSHGNLSVYYALCYYLNSDSISKLINERDELNTL